MKPKSDAMKDLERVRRHKITIQQKIDGFDSIGNQVEFWAPWKTLMAEKTQLYGKEYYAASGVGEEQTTVFTVRYVPFIDEIDTATFRLIYAGKIYDIIHLDHLPGEVWVKMKAIIRANPIAGKALVDHELVQGLKTLVEEILHNSDVAITEEDIKLFEEALAKLLEGQ